MRLWPIGNLVEGVSAPPHALCAARCAGSRDRPGSWSGAPSTSATTDICMSYRQGSGRSGTVCEPNAGSGTVMTTKGPLCPQSLVRKAHLEPMIQTAFSCYLRSVIRKL